MNFDDWQLAEQDKGLANFDFDYEYQQQLEQEQVELMNKYGLQNFNELFNQEGNQPCH